MTPNRELNQGTRTGLYSPGKGAEVERITLQLLLANEEARAILSEHLPGILEPAQYSMAMRFTLEQVAGTAPGVFADEMMQSIAEELAQLSRVAASDLPEPPKLTLWQRLLAKLASWRARWASQ